MNSNNSFAPAVDGSYYEGGRPEMLEFVPQTARRILEVGCAEGNFAKQLKERNQAELWGVELVEAAAAKARPKLDRVLVGSFDEVSEQLLPGYFDAIIFNDVLEHLMWPETALEKCKSLLNETGVIVASIPNVRHFSNLKELLLRKDWEYKDCGILDRTHLRFFTEKSIRTMFVRAGYTILRFTGINAHATFKVRLLEWLTLGHSSDIKFLEFAVVARVAK
jgi:2-polyprenyl-3-methyl-5-hydroxy-6-metoxy-1,4-benzoquinol methylase